MSPRSTAPTAGGSSRYCWWKALRTWADTVRAMVENPGGFTVATGGAYAYNALLAVQEEIVETHMVNGNGDVVACSVGWHTVDGKAAGFGESGKESRVIVSVKTEKGAEYAALLQEAYGGMVVVETSDGIFAEDTAAAEHRPGANPAWIVLAALAVCLLGSGVWLARRRALAAATGQVVTGGGPISRQAVRQAVRASEATPRRTFEDLRAQLEKQ